MAYFIPPTAHSHRTDEFKRLTFNSAGRTLCVQCQGHGFIHRNTQADNIFFLLNTQ